MAFIETKQLEKTYRTGDIETRVLRGISLSIEKGDFVSIMGPSGSGKSTLLHIVGFLDRQTGGEYYFNGKAIHDFTPNDCAHIRNETVGFVFQMFNLLARTSVLENVKLPLAYSSVPEHEWDTLAKRAIESVGLTYRIDHVPSKLSGGEQQRVAIARALVRNPQVILADEPTGNLDSKASKAIMEIFEELNQKRGHTILLVTHEMFIAEHARRIITIRDGVIATDITVATQRKAGDYTK